MDTMRGGRLGGGATVLSDPDDDAMGVARVQEGLLPVRIGQVDPDGLDARRLYQGQRVLDVGDEEAEVVRARAAASQEAVEKAAPEFGGGDLPGGPVRRSDRLGSGSGRRAHYAFQDRTDAGFAGYQGGIA
jgi:hypothetical protein